MPTRLLTSLGLRILPDVSEPRAANASPIAEETPLPLELPLGSWPG